MPGKRTRFPNEKGEWKCAKCLDWFPIEEFGGNDKRGTGTRPRSYCKVCHKASQDRTRLKRREARMRKQIIYIALLNFLQDNAQVRDDLIRRYTYQFEPYIRKAEEQVIEEWNNRSKAMTISKIGGGQRYPLQKALLAKSVS